MKLENYFNKILEHKKLLLIAVALAVLLTPPIINYLNNKPMLIGGESYYHLTAEPREAINNPLIFLVKYVPDNLLFILPIIFAFGTILCLLSLIKSAKPEFTFFYLLILIISPAFIYTFTTISAYSFFLLLFLLGLVVLNRNSSWKYFCVLFFVPAAFFDLLSTFLMLISLAIIFYLRKKDKMVWLTGAIGLFFLTAKQLLLKTPLVYGPFHAQQFFPDFIADFGGLNGISFFVVILALIGILVTWKQEGLYWSYLFLPVVIIATIYNTQAVFFLTLLTTFFATAGLIKLLERQWTLSSLKKFTILLIFLSLLFSTISFINRLPLSSPTSAEQKSLVWIYNNVDYETVIFTLPEDSYYISYFTKKEPFYKPHTHDEHKEEATTKILTAAYISELFPLLEENEIKFIFITPKMRAEAESLLFLLKNERFKLAYSTKEVEIWMFK